MQSVGCVGSGLTEARVRGDGNLVIGWRGETESLGACWPGPGL